MRTWIQTYSGKRFELSGPIDPELIGIEDIAHSLSMQCRYNGHSSRFYSVAEHSVAMSHMVMPEARLYALLHDAAEAYIGDIITPLKTDAMRALENKIMEAIVSRFNPYLTAKVYRGVKKADLRMLATEKEILIRPGHEWEMLEGIEPYTIRLDCWTPLEAKNAFLARFIELIKEGGV